MFGIVLGSVLAFAAVFSLTGLFDGSNDNDTTPDPEEPTVTGGSGNDTLAAGEGRLEGWGGDDRLTLTGDAEGTGDRGNDTIVARGNAKGYGGVGNDTLFANDCATVWGDNGNDRVGVFSDDADAPASGYGGAGNDSLLAAGGTAYGGTGSDFLRGQGLDDDARDAGLGTTLFGGIGNDVLIGARDVQVFGEGGDDILQLSSTADGFGGAGNDLLVLGPTTDATVSNDGTILASGGGGADIFALDVSLPTADLDASRVVITDYTPGTDRLVVEAAPSADYIYDSAAFTEGTDPSYTEITLTWRALEAGEDALTSVIRLEGVQDFDPGDLEVVSTVTSNFADDAAPPSIGTILETVDGTSGADQFTNQRSVLLDTGSGADSVATAKSGDLVVELGAGDDTLTANGASHVAFGGAGNDTYLMNATDNAPGGEGPTLFDGGAGRDTITIRGDGADSLASFSFEGGAGDDRLEAFAGTEAMSLAGGAGEDILIGRAGQTLTDFGTATESNDFTVTISAAELAAQGPATINMSEFDDLTLNIDPSLTGPVTTFFNTTAAGEDVIDVQIRVGDVTVAVIVGVIAEIPVDAPPPDLPVTINRA
jgi:Ca2+-binding RTX toxin-like protein